MANELSNHVEAPQQALSTERTASQRIIINPRNELFLKLLDRLRMEYAVVLNTAPSLAQPWITPFLNTVERTLNSEHGPTENQIKMLKELCNLFAVQVRW